MPPHKSVPTLKVLCRDLVLYNVCAVILDEIFFSEDETWEADGPPQLSVRLQMVKDVLVNCLSPSLISEILNVILEKNEEVEPVVKYVAVQLLLFDGIRNLTIGRFPEYYYNYVLKVIYQNGTSVEKLDLRGIWVKDEHKLVLYKMLRRLGSMKHLTLRYTCDDEMLTILGKHCTNLQRLDITGSMKISENGVKNLCYRHESMTSMTCLLNYNLIIVDIGGPGAQDLPPEYVCHLLQGLPNLQSIGGYEKTGKALKVIYDRDPSVRFQLRYLHDTYTSSETLYAITQTCPHLQALYLDSPKSISLRYLDSLKQLSEIKLHRVKWDDLIIYLRKKGVYLRNLCLLTVWGQVDLLECGSLCPNLVRFEVHNASLLCGDTNHDTAFKRVRELLIYTTEISTACVKLLLNQCLLVEHLVFGDCGHLSDAAMISCMMDHSLKHANSIWFGVAEHLTMRTLQALLEQCPLLTSLGNLATWGITAPEIQLVRSQLHVANVDLTLHEIGPDVDIENDWLIVI